MQAGDEAFVWDGSSFLFLDWTSSLFASTHLYCVHGISLTKNWAEHCHLKCFQKLLCTGTNPKPGGGKKKPTFTQLLVFLHDSAIDLWVESAIKNLRLRVHTLESDKISVDTVFYWMTPYEMRNVLYVNIPSLISFIMWSSFTHGYVFFFTLERLVNSTWNLIFITHIDIYI